MTSCYNTGGNEIDRAISVVQNDGFDLKRLSDTLRANREVVLAAVKQNGHALQFAGGGLRADREIVHAAIQRHGGALRFADPSLRANREVVLAAVQENGLTLQFASDKLRANRKVVLAAVQQHGLALQDASKDLCADREVVLAAVRQDGMALRYASEYLCADREVALAAAQQDVWALQFADEVLQQDEQFVTALSDVCPLGIVWRYKPRVTLAGTARKAMRSEMGLLLLAEQARVSLLGEPAMMKELLLSAMERGCFNDVLQTLIASQKKDILNALRTVMAWYGLDVPANVLVDLAPDSENTKVFCASISSALAGTRT